MTCDCVICDCEGCPSCDVPNGNCMRATSQHDWPLCDACYDYDNMDYESAADDEAGCNDCDGWVYIGDVCESCGLKGWATRDTDDGLICDDCGGKDGAHYSDCRVYA